MKPINISEEWLANKCSLGLIDKEITQLAQTELQISCSVKTIARLRKKYGLYSIY